MRCRAWIDDCRREWQEEYRYRLKKKSWLLNAAIWLFFLLYCITLNEILRAHLKKYLGYGRWSRIQYKFVELYVLGWLVIEIASLFYLGKAQSLFIGFLIWRLVDISQSWFGIGILHPEPSPYSIARMLILELVSFVEVAIIFGVFAFMWKDAFISILNYSTFSSVWQSLYHSVTTITTIGSDYTPVDWRGYLLFYGEILFGILFLVVVIQRVLSFFPRR